MKRFSAKAREQLNSRQSVWLRVFRETIGTDMTCVVVAVGENCDIMYGSEVRGIMQSVYAQYALATGSLTTLKPFSFVVEKG